MIDVKQLAAFLETVSPDVELGFVLHEGVLTVRITDWSLGGGRCLRRGATAVVVTQEWLDDVFSNAPMALKRS